MSGQEDNKRRHRRFTMDVLDIRGNSEVSYAAAVSDISISGVSVRTDKKLETGRQYPVRLMDDTSDLSLQGTVMWTAEDREAHGTGGPFPGFVSGIQFTGITQEQEKELIAFIQKHRADKGPMEAHGISGCRCNVRYRIDPDEAVLVNVPRTYRVKMLSLGGMLLESDEPLDVGGRLTMDMTMPDNSRIFFIGRVTTCRQVGAGSDELYQIGLAFIDMPKEDLERLRGFIKELYIQDAGF